MGLGPGYAVSKHVKLVRLLGRGGMGSVWIADHLGLKTQVAVKFMSDTHALDPAMRTRFQREATSAAQIGSPHIVNVHDHGITSDEIPYMVMELLDGEDLSTRIKRQGPMPLDDVAKIVSQVCKALGKAHRRGIVHRDIKPSNIFLVDSEGDIFVKVLDFGIAKPSGAEPSEVTNTGAIVGTIAYSSPEQLLNAKSVDYRADLWSLGVVAYRAMTGTLPFTDTNGIGALFLAMKEGVFVPPSMIVSTIPPEIDEWCKRAFENDPAARFDSAREMATAFYAALGRTSSPPLARLETSQSPRQVTSEGSTAGGSTSAGKDEKDTILEPDSPSSSQSQASNDRASTDFVRYPRSPGGAKDPSSLGGASAMTYVGEPGTNAPASRSSGRRLALIFALLTTLAGAGAFGFLYLKRSMKPPAGAPKPAAESEPNGVIAAPATASAKGDETPSVATPASSHVELAPMPPAPSASVSNAAAPGASASAASPKPSVKRGGTGRNPVPEKDYGF